MNAHNSPWRGRRVLVTGCTGFLGSAVTRELLDRGAVVVGLVRGRPAGVEFARERQAKQFNVVHGIVEDAIRLHSTMAVHEISAVFHLASSEPSGNDRGTAAVLRAAALAHGSVPVVTAKPAGQLRLASSEEDSSPVPLGIARFGEVFGGGDRKVLRTVPRTITALLAGDSVPVGDTSPRDFVFVRDAARACLALAEAVGTESESLDCAFRSGWEFTEREMTQFVAAVFAGRHPEVPDVKTPTNPLGWQPEASLAEAMGETIAWYREFQRTPLFVSHTADRKAA